ncbi:MAG: hypothetical protein ACE5GJ_02890 [Gemmatimonadota bacterium]
MTRKAIPPSPAPGRSFSGQAQSSEEPQLRPLSRPRPVEVRTDEGGRPRYVRLPGRTARRVEAVRERWRIDDEWWRVPICREYHDVILDDGRLLTLYHDILDHHWYVQS